jgi:Leu/Phe-tRNA-protein transferase
MYNEDRYPENTAPEYTSSGHILIRPEDNPDKIMDHIIAAGYDKESCLTLEFEPFFTARLMTAGFLIMSAWVQSGTSIILALEPMHHLSRSVLFFEDLHQSRSAGRVLSRYELRAGVSLGPIMKKCQAVHGSGWLTDPLIELMRKIKKLHIANIQPFSFGVYRNGDLKAGEFGIISGRRHGSGTRYTGGIYTSYSGYHDESSAGTVQMILTARWLRERGFAFWDLGMPLPYKETLGARVLTTEEFITIWRKAKETG